MTRYNETSDAGMNTYAELEAELYHKGHGARMEQRKMGNNTWLIRRGNNVVVRLHRTDILTFTPDERVILDHGGWDTVTTKHRMNMFLGRTTVSSSYGRWHVSVTMAFDDARSRQGPIKIRAEIPYENGMVLDTRTGHVVEHPEAVPIDLEVEIKQAASRMNYLGPIIHDLRKKMDDETITKDDLSYATMVANHFEEQHEHLRRLTETQERRAAWALQEFHDVIKQATTRHSEINYPVRERQWEVKGQLRASDLITPVDRSNNQ